MSDNGGSALASVKEAFSGTRGKVLLIGGAAVTLYLWWTRGRGGGSGDGVPEDQVVPTTGPGRVPQSEPPSGGTDQPPGGVTPRRPTTPEEWITTGIDLLVGRGVPSGAASSALTKALAAGQLTAQEIAWVQQVISAIGSPPGGMPPLNGTPPTPTRPSTPSGLRVKSVGRTTVVLTWGAVPGARFELQRFGGGSSPVYSTGVTQYSVTPLTPNTPYSFAVRAVTAAGASAWSARVSARTKK